MSESGAAVINGGRRRELITGCLERTPSKHGGNGACARAVCICMYNICRVTGRADICLTRAIYQGIYGGTQDDLVLERSYLLRGGLDRIRANLRAGQIREARPETDTLF
jgi:hypothetical protein